MFNKVMLVLAVAMYIFCVVAGIVFALGEYYFGAFGMLINAISSSFYTGIAVIDMKIERLENEES